jgi:hypothetical protein
LLRHDGRADHEAAGHETAVQALRVGHHGTPSNLPMLIMNTVECQQF